MRPWDVAPDRDAVTSGKTPSLELASAGGRSIPLWRQHRPRARNWGALAAETLSLCKVSRPAWPFGALIRISRTRRAN